MNNNWLQKLTESYISSKRELTESEMILEELNETKNYVLVLEYIIEELMNNDIINEEVIFAVLQEKTDRTAAHLGGLYNRFMMGNKGDGRAIVDAIRNRTSHDAEHILGDLADPAIHGDRFHPNVQNTENMGRDKIKGGLKDAMNYLKDKAARTAAKDAKKPK